MVIYCHVMVFFSAGLIGRIVLRRFKNKLRESNLVENILVGAGFYGTVAGLLAHFSVNYRGVYGVSLALSIILSWRKISQFLTGNRSRAINIELKWF